MGNNKLVSIGVASFNNQDYVIQTLESIKSQTYKNFEIIIVDDCSTDNSVNIINQWIKDNVDISAKLFVNNRNSGICKVWNQIVRACQGEFVAIIASDDLYYPDKLEIQVPLLDSLSEVGMITSPVSYINESGEVLEEIIYGPFCDYLNTATKEDAYIELLKKNYVSTMGTLVKRECFSKTGYYDEDLCYEDWDMWIRIAKEYKLWFSPIVSASYRIHSRSISVTRAVQLMESSIQLLNKQRGISPEADKIIMGHTKEMSEFLYNNNSKESVKWLSVRWKDLRDLRSGVLYVAASLGVKGTSIHKMRAVVAKLKSRA